MRLLSFVCSLQARKLLATLAVSTLTFSAVTFGAQAGPGGAQAGPGTVVDPATGQITTVATFSARKGPGR